MVQRAAIIGGGVIGGGWLARLIENGVPCTVFDPDPQAARKLGAVLAGAEHAYAALTAQPRPVRADWSLAGSVAEAAEGADLIVEAVPERLDVKRRVYAEIESVNRAGVIASSTSGIMPSDLQAEMAEPGRLIVAHPFNPVYLLPLVELVAGRATDPARIDWAKAFYASIGMHPLHCRVEIEGFLSDRLQEALWREALWLLHDEVATAEELDAAIAYGPGLRWAQMGTMQTFHLAGGEAGMRGMLAMFGPCLKWPWTKLMDVPELTDAFVDRVGDQCEAQSAGLGPRDLEAIRDANLIAILHALKAGDWGAGRTLAAYEGTLAARAGGAPADPSRPVETPARPVPAAWTEAGQLSGPGCGQLFAAGTASMLALAGAGAGADGGADTGADADADAGAEPDPTPHGHGFVTAETRVRIAAAVPPGTRVAVRTQVLAAPDAAAPETALDLHHALLAADGAILATGDERLVHVDRATHRPAPPAPAIVAALSAMAVVHARLPHPVPGTRP